MATFNVFSYLVPGGEIDNVILSGLLGFDESLPLEAADVRLVTLEDEDDILSAGGDPALNNVTIGAGLPDPISDVEFLTLTRDVGGAEESFLVARILRPNTALDILVPVDVDGATITSALPAGDFEVATAEAPTGNIALANAEIAAVDDSATTTENAPVTVSVLGNDTDLGQTLTITTVSQPGAGGTATTDGTTVSFDPGTDFDTLAGGESANVDIQYTATDGTTSSTATLSVTITGENDAPVVQPDTLSVNRGGTAVLDVLDNDSDPDANDTLTVTAVSASSVGTVELVNGEVRLTTAPDQALGSFADAFTYTVSDGTVEQTVAVTLTIDDVPDAPVATDDADGTDEDTDLTLDLLGNDTDADGDALSIQSVAQPARGSVAVVMGQAVFSPGSDFDSLAAGESTTETFTYTVVDDSASTLTDQATVTVTINGANDAPVAVDDTLSFDRGGSVAIDVLANDSDPDASDTLSLTEVTSTVGTVAIVNGQIELTTAPDQALGSFADAITYTVSDGTESVTATVSLTITDMADAPEVNNDNAATDQDTTVTIDVLANDTDADIGQTVSIQSVSQPARGSVVIENGQIVFDPGDDFDDLAEGVVSTETFTYIGVDDSPETLTDQGTVTVSVTGVNDAPVAVDDTATTTEDSGIVVDVLGNDSDVDGGDTLTVSEITQPANGLAVLDGGTLTFDPDGAFENLGTGDSATETFTYTVSDGALTSTATATVTIQGVNDAPTVAAPLTLTVTEEDGVETLDLLTGAEDVDDNTTLSIAGFTLVSGEDRGVSVQDTTLTLEAMDFNALAAGETAVSRYSFEVVDDDGGATAQTVEITVTGVNDVPVLTDDVFARTGLAPVTGDLFADNGNGPDFDLDTSDTLSITDIAGGGLTNVALPSGASVSAQAGGGFTYDPDSAFDNAAPGTVVTDSFTYTASDGIESVTATASFAFTIEGGTPGDDSFEFDFARPRTVDGAGGTDTLTVAVRLDSVEFEPDDGGFELQPTLGFALVLVSIERVEFDDATVVLADSATLETLELLYLIAFERGADVRGRSFWNGALDEDAIALTELGDAFVLAGEFGDSQGTDLSDEAFVQLVYLNATGRAADEAGLAFWVEEGLGAAGFDRGDLLLAFALSEEAAAFYEDEIDDGQYILA
ncbi:MAG: Ig-like domain-containing protein [Pseudomonadota bacterium]